MKMNKVTCPNCKTNFDIEQALVQDIKSQVKKDLSVKLNEKVSRIQAKEAELATIEKNLDQQKKQIEKDLEQRVNQKLKIQLQQEKALVKQELEEEKEEQIRSLNKELNEKSVKLKELNKQKAEIERLKRANTELEAEIKAEQEEKFNLQLAEAKTSIYNRAQEEHELKLRELEKQLQEQKALTLEMKRKQEQGSMQLQGEVQELAIEEWLSKKFPFDNIDEIKKGANGADCIQTINNAEAKCCGKIYYESKRTVHFQNSWLEKFKAEIKDSGAQVGVLVTQAMPKGMERMGLKDGIWICTFEEFKGLCSVLRQGIIELSTLQLAQENKGDKMTLLYNYLTSNQFKLEIQSIVDGFTTMQNDLAKEKRAMQTIWKKREKQIDKVLGSTTSLYGSLRGIAGNAVLEIPSLELGEE